MPSVTFDSPYLLQSPLVEQTLGNAKHPLKPIADKVLAGERLSLDEGLALYESNDLLYLGLLADFKRRQMHQTQNVYWVHNFHINPTNICEDTCTFCSFKKGPNSPYAYQMSVEDALNSVRAYPGHDTLREFHIVGGHYRQLTLAYHVELFKALKKEFPHVAIKGLTAAEIDFFGKIDGVTPEQCLQELKAAGLDALPGGGAEVFAERIRQIVCPDKITADRWLEIHGMAHAMGIPSNATMLAGLGETPAERVDHMVRLRTQQDKSLSQQSLCQGGGSGAQHANVALNCSTALANKSTSTGAFMSFIPLNCYYDNNKIDAKHALTGVENLKNFAVSRLMLDNIPHIKSFWIHIGEKMSQIGLFFGVDDVDGTVVHEKIAHAAGTESSEHLTRAQLEHLIVNAGRVPVERDLFYNVV
ncbi:MAG: CofH family radical SAM protein [Vampirovibrionales bacterium]|nr:CofH family radical SAM protein [Vampirovibrionales bacterium]